VLWTEKRGTGVKNENRNERRYQSNYMYLLEGTFVDT